MASQQLWEALNYLSGNLRVFAPIKDAIVQVIDENTALKEENAELKKSQETLRSEVAETQGIVNELIVATMQIGGDE